jgi:hypothetical protein
MLVIVVPLCMGLFMIVFMAHRETFEKSDINNFFDSKIIEKYTDVFKCYQFSHGEEQFLLFIFMEKNVYEALPSGPSACVFKKNGNFVDYCWDTGDAPVFLREWNYFENKEAITKEKIMQIHQEAVQIHQNK